MGIIFSARVTPKQNDYVIDSKKYIYTVCINCDMKTKIEEPTKTNQNQLLFHYKCLKCKKNIETKSAPTPLVLQDIE